MDISFIIVNWNTRGALLNCLASVRASVSEHLTHEILVVDNASSDGSAAEVRRAYPEITVIENEKNSGFAKANNQAMRLAQGRFFMLLNPDARFAPGSLDKLVDFMSEHPEAGMAGGQLLNRDGSRQNSFSAFPSLLTEIFNKSLLKMLFPFWFPGKYKKFKGPTKVDALIGACMVVRAAALKDVGLLDEAFFLFFEETDWCLRLAKAGWDIVLVPDATVFHAQGRSVEQDRRNALVEYYRSQALYFKKHKHPSQLPILRAGICLKMLVNVLWAAFMCIVTAGRIAELGARLRTLSYVLGWHLRGCPRRVGLANSSVGPNALEMRGGKVLVSACLITRNEEKNVRACLESLGFVDEIIVIDSHSDDVTPSICGEYTDKVYQTDWQGFSATKNLCIEQASNEWVLVIDADERVTPELRAEIMDLKDTADGYCLPRQNYFLGKWIRHSGWYPDYTLRLFKKSAGRFKDRAVHEAVELTGRTGYLKNPLLHYTYRDVASYIARLDRYSLLAAQQMMQDKPDRLGHFFDIATRPPFTFGRMYLLQLGFLDGLRGFLLAALHSFYVLAKYAKYWEMSCATRPPVVATSGTAVPPPKATESVRV